MQKTILKLLVIIKNNIDGFYKIFDYIAKNVSYNYEGVQITKAYNQNLIGAVLKNVMKIIIKD